MPAPLVKNAAMEAMDAGVKLVVLVADRVPLWDAMDLVAFARLARRALRGPQHAGRDQRGQGPAGHDRRQGVLRPGLVPAGDHRRHLPQRRHDLGHVLLHRSQAGLGISTAVHVGGDAIIGLREADVLREFQADPETTGVILFGEIGTSQEEEVAQLVVDGVVTKPIVAYVGGRAAKSGTRFSHAGAIVEGNRGSYDSKVQTLRAAGITVSDSFEQTFELASRVFAAAS